MTIEVVLDDDGIIIGHKFYKNAYGMPCNKAEASWYNFVQVDENGNPIRDYDCIFDNPNLKRLKGKIRKFLINCYLSNIFFFSSRT